MKNDISNYEELQNAYLDNLIEIALKYEDTMENECLLRTHHADFTDEEKQICKNAYKLFQEKLRRQEANEKRQRFRQSIRSSLPRIVNIAACAVLILGILSPIAIANVSALRSRVLQFLIQMEEDHAALRLINQPLASFDVPAEWQGEYYLSYIPEGYELDSISRLSSSVEYKNANGETLFFAELMESDSANIDNENATTTYESINGKRVVLFEKSGFTATWAVDDRYFVLITAENRETTLKIAEGVKKIIK